MQLYIIVGLKKADNKELLDFKTTVFESYDEWHYSENRNKVLDRLKVLQSDTEYTKVRLIEVSIREKDLARVMFEDHEIFGYGLKQIELIPDEAYQVKRKTLTTEAEVVNCK